MSEHLLPPRKRDWKRGIPQVGVFIRTKDGGTIEMVNDKASPDEAAFAFLLVRGLRHVPEEVVKVVREEWKRVNLAAPKRAKRIDKKSNGR